MVAKSAGGKARALALDKELLSEIGRKGAAERWNPTITRATHAGVLKIGEIELPCSVLSDSSRVLTLRGINQAFGALHGGSKKSADGVRNLPRILSHRDIEQFIPADLAVDLNNPKEFKPLHGGRSAFGYDATLLPRICEVIMDAQKGGIIVNKTAELIAETLIRGFARVGIIALVDEATGYQEVRDRDALQKILEQYVRKELAVWAKRFPDDFYQQIYRLRGWEWRGMGTNRISACAQYTKDLVYERLAPGLLKLLEERNPIQENGRRKGAHHQLLTEEVGVPELARHFGSVVTLAKISRTWDGFYALVNEIHPKRGDQLHMALDAPADREGSMIDDAGDSERSTTQGDLFR